MKQTLLTIVGLLVPSALPADTIGLDKDTVGAQPAGWSCDVTGRGLPIWTIGANATAPTGPNVLTQSSRGTFPRYSKADSGTSFDDFSWIGQ